MSLSFNDIPGAFDAGAPAYDKLVDTNPGYHTHLRLSAQRMRIPNGEGSRVISPRISSTNVRMARSG